MNHENMKMTEVGWIPKDWEVKTLGEVCNVKGRIGFRGYTKKDLVDKGFGAITLSPSNINDNHELDTKDATYISWFKYEESPEIKVYNNDILFVKTGSTYGKSALVKGLKEKATINPQFALLKDISCEPPFLASVITQPIIQKQVELSVVGGAIPTMSQQKISEFVLPFPPTSEQRRIASVLSDMDSLIASLSRTIEKKRLVKQGAMQQLLTGKTRLKGFSGEWVEKELGECADIYRGGSPRPIEAFMTTLPEGLNWIKIGDVANNAKYINKTAEKIIPEGERHSRFVRNGDLLLSNSMSFGRPYILRTDGCIHDGWLVIQNYKDEWYTDFLYYLLCSENVLEQYEVLAAGSGVKNLNKAIVSNVILRYPVDLNEQFAIANILTTMDNEIVSLEAELQKYKALKQGMMQKLLTGQIRLK